MNRYQDQEYLISDATLFRRSPASNQSPTGSPQMEGRYTHWDFIAGGMHLKKKKLYAAVLKHSADGRTSFLTNPL